MPAHDFSYSVPMSTNMALKLDQKMYEMYHLHLHPHPHPHLHFNAQVIDERDVGSVVKMFVSALSKNCRLRPETIRTALSHMFQRLGEVVGTRHQIIIDFGFATLVAEDRNVEVVIHGEKQQKRRNVCGNVVIIISK